MKKITIFLAALLLMGFSNAFSQKCKVGTDPITNEHSVSFDYANRTVFYEYKGALVNLELKFDYNGVLKVIVPQGTEIIFKLENGEIMKLVTASDAPPKTDASSSMYSTTIYTNYYYPIQLSKDQVKQLATSKVVLIRYPDTQGGTRDFEPKGLTKKLADVLQKGALCIQENF